jgi:uncharacterized protein
LVMTFRFSRGGLVDSGRLIHPTQPPITCRSTHDAVAETGRPGSQGSRPRGTCHCFVLLCLQRRADGTRRAGSWAVVGRAESPRSMPGTKWTRHDRHAGVHHSLLCARLPVGVPCHAGPFALPFGRTRRNDLRVSEILELPYDKCDQLLRAGVFGRMVLSRPTGPEIVPVNYVVVGDAVLVRTSPGSLLDRYADGAALAFEVDAVNYERWHGWSVVARGRGERVPSEELAPHGHRVHGPPRWVSRDEEAWIRLRWVTLTGRRIGSGWSPLGEMPVRRASR